MHTSQQPRVRMAAASRAAAAFVDGRYDEAIQLFAEASESSGVTDADRAVLLCNRAATYERLRLWPSMLADSERALECDAANLRAHVLRAAALRALGRASAEEAYDHALSCCGGGDVVLLAELALISRPASRAGTNGRGGVASPSAGAAPSPASPLGVMIRTGHGVISPPLSPTADASPAASASPALQGVISPTLSPHGVISPPLSPTVPASPATPTSPPVMGVTTASAQQHAGSGASTPSSAGSTSAPNGCNGCATSATAASSPGSSAAAAPIPPSVTSALALAVKRVNAGQHAEAVRYFDEVLVHAPTLLVALVGRGTARALLGELAPALADLDAALSVAPSERDVLHRRLQVLHALGRRDEVVSAATQVLHLEPSDAAARALRGAALRERRDYAGAAADFRSLCSSTSASDRQRLPEHLHELGTALAARGELAEAIDAYERAIAIRPEAYETRINLGQVRVSRCVGPAAVALLCALLRADGSITCVRSRTLPVAPGVPRAGQGDRGGGPLLSGPLPPPRLRSRAPSPCWAAHRAGARRRGAGRPREGGGVGA